jgi:hypothetical protein
MKVTDLTRALLDQRRKDKVAVDKMLAELRPQQPKPNEVQQTFHVKQ